MALLDSNTIEYVIKVRDEGSKALGELKKASLAAAAALAGIGFMIKGAMDFEKAMREVATLSGDIAGNLDNFNKEVLDLSSSMGIDAVEAAGAMYQAISAGVPAENVIDFLTLASKAAIGGVTDLETAVDGITTVINAFKLPMEDATAVSDMLFTTMKAGKTTISLLAKSLFNVAPIANAAGVEFREIAAALAVQTAQGTLTSVATTQLRAAIVGITRPSKDLTKIWNKLGYETGQASIQGLGFQKTLSIVAEAAKGDVGVLTTLLGSQEAASAAFAITGENAAWFADQLDKTTNSAGATQAAFEIMAESVAFKWDIARESFQNVTREIGIGLLPTLVRLLETITLIISKIGEFARNNEKLVTSFIVIIASISALIIGLTGLGILVTQIGIAVKALAIALPFLGGVLATIGLPILVLIAALVALGVAIYVLYQLWEKNFLGMRDMTDQFVVSIQYAFNQIKVWLGILGENFLAAFNWIKSIIVTFFQWAGMAMPRSTGIVIEAMKVLWNGFGEFTKGFLAGIGSLFIGMLAFIYNIFTGAGKVQLEIAFWTMMSGWANIVKGIANTVVSAIEGMVNLVLGYINRAIQAIIPFKGMLKKMGIDIAEIAIIPHITLPRAVIDDLKMPTLDDLISRGGTPKTSKIFENLAKQLNEAMGIKTPISPISPIGGAGGGGGGGVSDREQQTWMEKKIDEIAAKGGAVSFAKGLQRRLEIRAAKERKIAEATLVAETKARGRAIERLGEARYSGARSISEDASAEAIARWERENPQFSYQNPYDYQGTKIRQELREFGITINVDGSLIGASIEELAAMIGEEVMKSLGVLTPVR